MAGEHAHHNIDDLVLRRPVKAGERVVQKPPADLANGTMVKLATR